MLFSYAQPPSFTAAGWCARSAAASPAALLCLLESVKKRRIFTTAPSLPVPGALDPRPADSAVANRVSEEKNIRSPRLVRQVGAQL